jgi:hypothetical protein
VRRPREFRVEARAADDRLAELEEGVRLREEADRFVEPEREALDRFTDEPLLADRPEPERPRWAKAAS